MTLQSQNDVSIFYSEIHREFNDTEYKSKRDLDIAQRQMDRLQLQLSEVQRLVLSKEEEGSELKTNCDHLKVKAGDCKERLDA